MNRLLALSVLLVPGCEYFSEVTIPANDNVAPTAYTGIWANGDYIELTYNNFDAVDYETDDTDTTFVLVAAGYDSGGVSEVNMYFNTYSRCESGNLAQESIGDFGHKSETQAGDVGDVVDNGLWTSFSTQFDPDRCPEGYVLASAYVEWSVETEDFHGNVNDHGTARITYVP